MLGYFCHIANRRCTSLTCSDKCFKGEGLIPFENVVHTLLKKKKEFVYLMETDLSINYFPYSLGLSIGFIPAKTVRNGYGDFEIDPVWYGKHRFGGTETRKIIGSIHNHPNQKYPAPSDIDRLHNPKPISIIVGLETTRIFDTESWNEIASIPTNSSGASYVRGSIAIAQYLSKHQNK